MIPPEYFDIVGFALFIGLLITGIKIRKKEKTASIFVVTVAILGLLADGYIIINKFILK
jgi:hypothetical protein